MVKDRELDKLREDLDRWVAQGVISPARRDEMLAEVTAQPAKARRGGLSVMPFIMGVLIAAGITVAVAGASDPFLVPRPLAILILMLSIAGALALGQWLTARSRILASEVAVVTALGLFGASIFFITNVYFIDRHPPDLVVIWSLAALVAAALLPSRGALAVGIVTGTVWSLMEVQVYRIVFHWPYLPLWVVAFCLATYLPWRSGLHLAAVGLAAWMSVNVLTGAQVLLGWGSLDMLCLGIIAGTGLWVAGRYLEHDRWGGKSPFPFPRTLEYYGLGLVLLLVFMVRYFSQYQAPYPIWQLIAAFSSMTVIALALSTFQSDRHPIGPVVGMLLFAFLYPNLAPILYDSLFIIQHGLFVVLALWVVSHGVRMRDSVIVALGLAGLCAEVVAVYAQETGAQPGDTLLIGLGFVLALLCVTGAVIAHRTLFKGGRQTTGDS